MIKWCTYCQTYQGEVEPYEIFTLSHGICKNCIALKTFDDSEKIRKAESIRVFYENLRLAIKERDVSTFKNTYATYISLNIQPAVFVRGIMQPLLYEVGQLWLQGKVTVAYEHFYSGVSAEILEMIHNSLATKQFLRQSQHPRVALMLAPGNYHSFGLKIVELLLMLSDIPSYVMPAHLNRNRFLEMMEKLSPGHLGISAALPSHALELRQFAEMTRELNSGNRYTVIAGGFAFRQAGASEQIPGVQILSDLSELLDVIA